MIGELLGNYRVLRKLGEGGMGTVYLAEHKLIGRKVAVKVLLPEFSRQEEILQRFFNEARAAASITHPGVVQVLDYGQHTDGSAYLVMEYLCGEPLSTRLERLHKLPIGEALRIGHHCASALAAAHAAGVIHRDLKPDNIFLVPDPQVDGGERAKLLDFGIAKLKDKKGRSPVNTQPGNMVGTPVYMSPEQCRGTGEIDHRSDIYALGCVLFRMLCGRPPFADESVGEVIACHLREPPPSPRDYEPQVPPELEAAVRRALAKEPDERFADMGELAAALKSLGRLPSIPPLPERAVPEPQPPRWSDSGSTSADREGDGESKRSGAPRGRDARRRADSTEQTTRQLRAGTHDDSANVPVRDDTTLGNAASQKLRLPRRSRRSGVAAAAAAVLVAMAAAVLVHRVRDGAPAEARWDAAATAAQPAREEPARPASITVVIDSEPPGATVYQGTRELGQTPYVYTAAPRPGKVTLKLRKPGYRTMSVTFPANRSDSIIVAMVARKPAATPPSSPRDPSPGPAPDRHAPR